MAARRELTFLLAEPERRLLRAIAARLPPWMTSDGLTVLGMVGALGTGVAYALATLSAAWLWAASALLVVNWLGDSLDGTLARVRRAERPRYGYYLDHVVDAFSTAAIGAGIGLSPYVNLGVALAGVVAYLILSINIYLESQAFGVFRLGYSRIGPTEARIVLIAANVALASSLECSGWWRCGSVATCPPSRDSSRPRPPYRPTAARRSPRPARPRTPPPLPTARSPGADAPSA